MASAFEPHHLDVNAEFTEPLGLHNPLVGCEVHKFGGSSLASRQRLQNVAQIIGDYTRENDLIVVSANGDVTDWLVEFAAGDTAGLEKFVQYYGQLVNESLSQPHALLQQFYQQVDTLAAGQLSSEEILAQGELWSARLMTAILNQCEIDAQMVDARDWLVTDCIESFENFDTDRFRQAVEKQLYGNYGKRLVVTGYIASDIHGNTITLGRNGSDYTATLLARFAQAKSVVLWTDVKGIFSADPRLIHRAEPIGFLSYQEANALAAVGTNVLHQKTIAPLVEHNILLNVRSSLEPAYPGTCVGGATRPTSQAVKSVAVKPRLLSLTIHCDSDSAATSLQHQLFAHHLIALDGHWDQQKHQWQLLLDEAVLANAIQFFEQQGLDYQLERRGELDSQTVIALVGENLGEHPTFFEKLQQRLQGHLAFRLASQSHRHSIHIIIQTRHPHKALGLVYDACFGNVEQSGYPAAVQAVI